MVLAYNARDATMDLDAAIRDHHGPVVTEARAVAEQLGCILVAQRTGNLLPASPTRR